MRKIIQNVLLIGIVFGLGIIFNTSTSRAATLKSTSPDNINNGGNWVTYFPNLTKIKSHNAYMWNMKHTKKIHNLNSYKNTDWYIVQTFTRTVNSKKSTYFKVTNFGKKITGLVYGGYPIKAKVTPITSFNNDLSYKNYLESSQTQKLARGLMKLFPNSKVTLKLSKYIHDNPMTETDVTSNQPGYTSNVPGYKDVFAPEKAREIFSPQTLALSFTTINKLSNYFDTHGYNAQKRASMKDYELGVYVQNAVSTTANDKNNMPASTPATTQIEFILAKPIN